MFTKLLQTVRPSTITDLDYHLPHPEPTPRKSSDLLFPPTAKAIHRTKSNTMEEALRSGRGEGRSARSAGKDAHALPKSRLLVKRPTREINGNVRSGAIGAGEGMGRPVANKTAADGHRIKRVVPPVYAPYLDPEKRETEQNVGQGDDNSRRRDTLRVLHPIVPSGLTKSGTTTLHPVSHALKPLPAHPSTRAAVPTHPSPVPSSITRPPIPHRSSSKSELRSRAVPSRKSSLDFRRMDKSEDPPIDDRSQGKRFDDIIGPLSRGEELLNEGLPGLGLKAKLMGRRGTLSKHLSSIPTIIIGNNVDPPPRSESFLPGQGSQRPQGRSLFRSGRKSPNVVVPASPSTARIREEDDLAELKRLAGIAIGLQNPSFSHGSPIHSPELWMEGGGLVTGSVPSRGRRSRGGQRQSMDSSVDEEMTSTSALSSKVSVDHPRARSDLPLERQPTTESIASAVTASSSSSSSGSRGGTRRPQRHHPLKHIRGRQYGHAARSKCLSTIPSEGSPRSRASSVAAGPTQATRRIVTDGAAMEEFRELTMSGQEHPITIVTTDVGHAVPARDQKASFGTDGMIDLGPKGVHGPGLSDTYPRRLELLDYPEDVPADRPQAPRSSSYTMPSKLFAEHSPPAAALPHFEAFRSSPSRINDKADTVSLSGHHHPGKASENEPNGKRSPSPAPTFSAVQIQLNDHEPTLPGLPLDFRSQDRKVKRCSSPGIGVTGLSQEVRRRYASAPADFVGAWQLGRDMTTSTLGQSSDGSDGGLALRMASVSRTADLLLHPKTHQPPSPATPITPIMNAILTASSFDMDGMAVGGYPLLAGASSVESSPIDPIAPMPWHKDPTVKRHPYARSPATTPVTSILADPLFDPAAAQHQERYPVQRAVPRPIATTPLKPSGKGGTTPAKHNLYSPNTPSAGVIKKGSLTPGAEEGDPRGPKTGLPKIVRPSSSFHRR